MTNRSALLLALLFVALMVAYRSGVSGWGPPSVAPAASYTAFGITAFPADNLAYVSWAQQSARGAWLYSDLYTTSEHGHYLFNLLFLIVGLLAGLFDTAPLLIMNLLGLLALPLFVFSVANICRLLKLGGGASAAAIFLALGGGGISWLRWAIGSFGLDGIFRVGAPGPDLSYFDLYPLATAFIYPSHAISTAIIAFLALQIVRYDDHETRLTVPGGLLLFGTALALALIRPYEPLMVLAAYGAVLAASAVFRAPRTALLRRGALFAGLAASMLPPVLYVLWVSRQPIWREFAEAGIGRGYLQGEWATGMLVLWVLAGIGVAVVGWRAVHTRFAFPLFWALGCAALLLVLDSGHSKVVGGGTVSLALLAGAAVQHWWARWNSRLLRGGVIAAIAFLALASTALTLARYAAPTYRTYVNPDLLAALDAIRRDSGEPFPTVLADCGSGVMIPGLAGFRVYCGHWALSDRNRDKIALLETRLGLRKEQDGPSVVSGRQNGAPAATAQSVDSLVPALSRQIRDGTFDYLMTRPGFEINRDLPLAAPNCLVRRGEQYIVLRMCPQAAAALARRL